MVGKACLPSNAYYPRTPDYTLYSGVHVRWSEHSDLWIYEFGLWLRYHDRNYFLIKTYMYLVSSHQGISEYPVLATYFHKEYSKGPKISNTLFHTFFC